MSNVDARAAFVRILLEKIREDKYPSSTHMAIVEQTLPAEWVPDYLEVLLEKVAEDRNPSIPMLQRIQRVLDAVP
jgi:hypothetical protein